MPLAPFTTESLFLKHLETELKELFPYAWLSVGPLGNDSLFFHVSMEPRDEWPNKIYHNSHYLICSIRQVGGKLVLEHVATTFVRDTADSIINLPKIRKINDASLTKIVDALVKWEAQAQDIINQAKG